MKPHQVYILNYFNIYTHNCSLVPRHSVVGLQHPSSETFTAFGGMQSSFK